MTRKLPPNLQAEVDAIYARASDGPVTREWLDQDHRLTRSARSCDQFASYTCGSVLSPFSIWSTCRPPNIPHRVDVRIGNEDICHNPTIAQLELFIAAFWSIRKQPRKATK